jgi:hypothetical protein
MRDMMAQIRDVGDGVRDGTYTMTAVKITGGTINGATIGATTATTGAFTTINASTSITNAGLTSGRVTFAGASGLLSDSANLTFSGTNLSVGTQGEVRVYNTANTRYGRFVTTDDGTILESFNGSNEPLVLSAPSNGDVIFKTNGTEKLRITGSSSYIYTASGVNVGIGTSSPSYKLHVRGTDATAVLVVGNTSEGTQLEVLTYQDDKVVLRSNDTSNVARALAFETGTSERMRIDSSGLLLVGTTSAFNAAYTMSLKVSGSTGGLIIQPGADNYTAIQFNNAAGSGVGSISVTSSATAYNTSSDYRLKEDIAPMTGALATVAQLKPVTYKWKSNGSDGQGFIAHELQAVVPDCVSGEKDATYKDGSIKPQGVDTSFLVATLTAAIQEQQALIESLTTRLTALENR